MEKEKSYMLALPQKEKQIKDVDLIMNYLKNANEFIVKNIALNKGTIFAKIEFHNEDFEVEIFPEAFEMFEMYRTQHLFKDLDIKKIEKSKAGLCVAMMFGDKFLDCYHLQLKIINCIVPDALAVVDYCSEKILSGKWVALAAKSSIPPAPRYIYTVQAVSEEKYVWLHTHGLNRCGITEIEILNSTKETYNNHYSILESLASRLLDTSELPEEKEPIFLARLTSEVFLVVTLVHWKEAISYFDNINIGGFADRQEGHNENTSVVFAYASKEDSDNENYVHVSVYDDILSENPIYMLTTKETARMKSLALERLDYVRKAFKDKKNTVILKIGLEIDDEYRSEANATDENSKEHIWFELKEFDDNTVTAELTQEPYYINGLHEGHVGKYSIEEITDWLIFTPNMRISSDEVYIL